MTPVALTGSDVTGVLTPRRTFFTASDAPASSYGNIWTLTIIRRRYGEEEKRISGHVRSFQRQICLPNAFKSAEGKTRQESSIFGWWWLFGEIFVSYVRARVGGDGANVPFNISSRV